MRYYFNCVEQMIMNPHYKGYRSFRVEVFDRKSKEWEQGYAAGEANFLVPEALFEALYNAFDGKESDVIPSISWDMGVDTSE